MHYSALGHHPQCYNGVARCLCNSGQPLGLAPDRLASSTIIPEPPMSYRLSPGQIHMIYSSQSKPWTREELEENFIPQQQTTPLSHPLTQSTYHLTPDQVRMVYSAQFNPALREQVRKTLLSLRGNIQQSSYTSSSVSHQKLNQSALQQHYHQQQQYSQYRYASTTPYARGGVNSNYPSGMIHTTSPSPSGSSTYSSSGYSSGYVSGSPNAYYSGATRSYHAVTPTGYISKIQVTEDDDDDEDDDEGSESEDGDSYTQSY